MKKSIAIISLLWLVINLLFGLLLSAYSWTNVVVSSAVIIITAVLLWLTNSIVMKDAFKVSLTILFALMGIVEYGIACFMPQHLEDNWGVITIIVLMAIQAVLVIATNVVSNRIK